MTDGGCAEYISRNSDDILQRMPDKYDMDMFWESSENMSKIGSNSVDLIVTSPPYPMVEQWDSFGSYEEQHDMINSVIEESWRILHEGGIMCINIGDATRSVDDRFQCYPNHSEVTINAREVGFGTLVPIHWFKPTNKPNSFLGSGFHPPNCYVTQDTEYILIFRKRKKRELPEDRVLWNASQFTKEERDTWFCQQWGVGGKGQDGTAQFPVEIPYRLIRMFSLIGDTVLDPFAGTGTTIQIARALGRYAVGYEINSNLQDRVADNLDKVRDISSEAILANFIRNEENNLGPEVFIRNPTSLIDYL